MQFTTQKKRCFSENGFTLIELLIVFGIISFLAAGGLAVSTKFGGQQTLQSAAQDIRNALYSARSEAQAVVSTQCASGVAFTGIKIRFCNSKDKNNVSCTSTQCTNNSNPDYEVDLICGGNYQATLQTHSLPNANMNIKPDSCTVLFQPYNNPVVGSGNIVVSGQGNSKTITVSANGAIQ